jgi:hypothetical protein
VLILKKIKFIRINTYASVDSKWLATENAGQNAVFAASVACTKLSAKRSHKRKTPARILAFFGTLNSFTQAVLYAIGTRLSRKKRGGTNEIPV